MATSSAVGNDRYLSEENRESSNAQHSVGHPSVNNADQDATIELPFHGSCPRCHHLHTNTGLRYFCNLKKHLRMKCEHCHHEMFGLGSDSTQTSLASEETLSRQNSWFSIRSSCTNVPRGSTIELDPTRLAQPPQDLGTIAETISLDGRSVISGHRSASSLAAERVPGSGNGGVSRAQSVTITSPSIAEGSVSAIRKGSEGTLEGGNQPQTTTPSQRFRKWKDKISYWIGRIGEWKGTKIEMTLTLGRVSPTVKISRVPTGENPHASICQVKESQPPQVEHATTSVNTSSIHPLQAATADPVDEKPAAEPSDAAVELAEEESHLRVAKRQRISVQRREKTLKKKAMGKPGCQCSDECHCMGLMHSSSSNSEARSQPISTSAVPDHLLGHLWGGAEGEPSSDSPFDQSRSWSPTRHVAFAGSWANSSSARNSHRRSGHSYSWGSQATTAVSSEGAISLDSYRPASRRSHSLPPLRQLLHYHGPAIRDALRDDTVHHHLQSLAHEARNSDSPPPSQASTRVNSIIARAVGSDFNQDDVHSILLPHASSTRLAHLAGSDSEGEIDHSPLRDSSVHSRTSSVGISQGPEPTTDGREGSVVSPSHGFLDGAPNSPPHQGPDALYTELDHLNDGTATPPYLGLASQHPITSTTTNQLSHPTSGDENDSTPTR